ncbi:MAG: phosphatidylglycerophosphatase A family protein [Bryobacteraceae bacterium]
MKGLAVALATWFGCGYVPFAPGTAGSIAAVAMAIAIEYKWSFPPLWFLLAAAALLWPGVWAADVAAKQMKLKDPRPVVVDEVIGQWVTISGATVLNWKSWLGALLLFRVLDVWKPFPVRRLEALPGGTGIVADDVMAGIYGALVLFIAGCFNLY